MSKVNPASSKGAYFKPPLLRSEIIEAQKHTKSNRAAAKYLGTSYERYKKYAKLYNLFDSHANPLGIGVDKGFSKNPRSIPLRDILAGKHPKYSLSKLKNRLLARKKIVEECSLCGFDEKRITDGKVPLMLTFKNEDRTNFALDNLELRCYNCMFLTTGAPSVVNRNQIKKSFNDPELIPKTARVEPTVADQYDATDTGLADVDIVLTDEEKDALLDDI